jgi:hypothetical protein
MSRRCPFCYRIMDSISKPGAIHTPHFECQGCGCEWIHGLHKLPSPERLRSEAESLEALADEIDQADGLAGRLQTEIAGLGVAD